MSVRPACFGRGQLFFSMDPEELAQARSHCLPCPQREACLDRAIADNEKWGVYGGVLVYRGRFPSLYIRRPPGRPPKDHTFPQIQLDPNLVPERHANRVMTGELPRSFAKGLG